MKRYKGYYIDGVIFSNKKEIDDFIKKTIIGKIKTFHDMLFSGRYSGGELIAISNEITIREKRLHDEYNMSWEDIEMIPYTE